MIYLNKLHDQTYYYNIMFSNNLSFRKAPVYLTVLINLGNSQTISGILNVGLRIFKFSCDTSLNIGGQTKLFKKDNDISLYSIESFFPNAYLHIVK